MKSLALLVAAGLLLALGAVAGACGGDGGGLSLEEYFAKLDAAQNEVDRKFEEAFQQEEPGLDTSEEDVAAFAREIVQDFSTILADAEGTIGDLEPPAEAEDAHDALVQAIGGARTAIESAVDDIPGALSLEELETFFGSSELETATGAIDEACKELQLIADDNQIDVDLECESEE
jgi:hypothetical protein